MSALTESAAWQALAAHRHEVEPTTLRDLFAQDAKRGELFSRRAAGILFDYSRQRVSARTLDLLFELARQQRVEAGIAAMFAGEVINPTESRAALHVALRNFTTADKPDWSLQTQGTTVMPDVAAVLAAMAQFCDAIHRGRRRGYSERRFTDVVNLGIGGSDLGPRLVCEALRPHARSPLRLHFVANVDPDALDTVLAALKPESTLFIVTSKTFTTAETMANAHAARDWLARACGDESAIGTHFAAVTTNREAAVEFGIGTDGIFGFWDWVGGRYSLWSAVGLPIALYLGMDAFRALLAGAHEMDAHFRDTALADNLPVLLALIGVWNINFLGAATQVVVPYSDRLGRLPDYLQQLEMESNGKSVDRAGQPVDYATAPVVWGSVGTNAQHAFFQLLHQGPAPQPVDFILPLISATPRDSRQQQLLANCMAQAEALMRGKSAAEVRAELGQRGLKSASLEDAIPHRVFPGNRPSTTLVLEELNPHSLGALLALYEHKVYVQGLVWSICSFDQWGVELGKQLAARIQPALETPMQIGADVYGDLRARIRQLK